MTETANEWAARNLLTASANVIAFVLYRKPLFDQCPSEVWDKVTDLLRRGRDPELHAALGDAPYYELLGFIDEMSGRLDTDNSDNTRFHYLCAVKAAQHLRLVPYIEFGVLALELAQFDRKGDVT